MIAFITFLAAAALRYYWPQDLATYASQGSSHTHIQLDGYVTYKASQYDGDYHIRVCDSPTVIGMNPARCVVCEITPSSSLARPAIRSHIRVQGVSRIDAEHRWREVHPLEAWTTLP